MLFRSRYSEYDATIQERFIDREIKSIENSFYKGFHNSENVTVLREENKIIGLYSCSDESEEFNNASAIWNVCLKPSVQGRGLGTKLMKHAIKRCFKEGQELILMVSKNNKRAKNLYEKLGFKTIEWDYDVDDNPRFHNKYLMKYFGSTSLLSQ